MKGKMSMLYFSSGILVLALSFSSCKQLNEKSKISGSNCQASQCHPSTPLKEKIPSSGKHTAHLTAGFNCENCHDGYLKKASHKDGVMDKDTDAIMVFFDKLNPAASWNNTTADCANIGCHGIPDSANWYDDSSGCTVCHKPGSVIDPLTTAGEGLNGKHLAHLKIQNIKCENCHKDYSKQPSHRNNVYGRLENVSIVNFGFSWPDSINEVSAQFDNGKNVCNNISCHANASGIEWYGDIGGCSVCHNASDSINPLKTNNEKQYGKHYSHVAMRGIECMVCHSGYKQKSSHMNGKYGHSGNPAEIENFVFFNGNYNGNSVSALFNGQTKNCDNISCHGNTGGLNWYVQESVSCNGCHQKGSGIDPLTTGSSLGSGKHTTHVEKMKIECTNCHFGYQGSNSHLNGKYGQSGIDPETSYFVFSGGSFQGQSVNFLYNKSTNGCDNISCHGNTGNVFWYSTGGILCTTCHASGSAIDPLSTNGQGISGKHIAHVSDKGLQCELCHQNYFDQVTHANGIYGKAETDTIINFGGKWPGTSAVSAIFTDSTGRCDNISCHANTGNIYWYNDGYGCTACHSPGTSIDPITTNGTGIQGKHLEHVTNKGIECVICHFNYKSSSTHMNGIYGKTETDSIIAFGGNWPASGGFPVNASFNDTSGECGTISCHGGVVNLNWYGATSFDCAASCHSSGSAIGGIFIDATSGSHLKHLSISGISCTDCHNNYKGNITHFNGLLNSSTSAPGMIGFQTDVNPNGNFNTGTCANIYCHGNFPGGNAGSSQPVWGTTVNCTNSKRCHGNDASGHPGDSLRSDGKHSTHIDMLISIKNPATGSFYLKDETCSVCHNGLGYGKPGHVNKNVNIAFNYANPEGAQGSVQSGGDYNGTTDEFVPIVCENSYCHGNFDGGNIYTVSWSMSKADASWCGSCHTTSPSSVKHSTHLNRYPNQCGYCHQNYTNTSTPPNHANLTKNVIFGYPHPANTGSLPTYTSATKTCNNTYCHGNFPRITYNGTPNINAGNAAYPTWETVSTASCGSCHGSVDNNYSSSTHGQHTVANRTYARQYYFGNLLAIESCDACHNYGEDTIRTFGTDSSQGSFNTMNHVNFSINDSGVNSDVNFKADNDDLASKTGPQTIVNAKTTWNGATTSCTNSWCHGNFNNGVDVTGNNATPDWLVPTTGDCGTCHTSSIHGKYGCGGNCHSGVYSEHANGIIGF